MAPIECEIARRETKTPKLPTAEYRLRLMMEREAEDAASSSGILHMGCRFCPTEAELVSYFLFNKITGRPFWSEAVKDYDLYGDQEPWMIWDSFASHKLMLNDSDLFFFSKLKKKTPTGSKINRCIGTGVWHGEDKGKEITTPICIGMKKRLKYHNKNVKFEGNWALIEYSLAQPLKSDIVLCQLRNLAKEIGKKENTDRGKKRKAQENDANLLSSDEGSVPKRLKGKEPMSAAEPNSQLECYCSSSSPVEGCSDQGDYSLGLITVENGDGGDDDSRELTLTYEEFMRMMEEEESSDEPLPGATATNNEDEIGLSRQEWMTILDGDSPIAR